VGREHQGLSPQKSKPDIKRTSEKIERAGKIPLKSASKLFVEKIRGGALEEKKKEPALAKKAKRLRRGVETQKD